VSGEQQDGAAGRGLLCRATGMHDGTRHYCTLNTAPHQVHQCGDCGYVWTDSGEEFEAVLAERDAFAARVAELEGELEPLREWQAALNEAQVSLQSSSFEVGWWKGFKAMPTAGVYTQAYLDTLAYADELRALNVESSLRQAESDAGADGGAHTGDEAETCSACWRARRETEES